MTGCGSDGGSGHGARGGPGADAASASPSAPAHGSASDALDRLTVKDAGSKTGYKRTQFGSPWVDTDGNHCDTRDDILARDLTGKTFRDGHCTVTSGKLHDPYTGTTIDYVRGHSRVDIDHAVALSAAWRTGAAGWPRTKRVALANDPLNLLASDSSANRKKGDGDAADWLPPNKPYRPTYVARQIAVKAKYGLWVTAAEKAAMKKVLAGPGGADVKLPTGGTSTSAPAQLSRSGSRHAAASHPASPTSTPKRSVAPAAPADSSPSRATSPSRAASPSRAPAAQGNDILSPSGRHYRAGQFCKTAHNGLTTHDAQGRTLTCGMESGRLHWHY